MRSSSATSAYAIRTDRIGSGTLLKEIQQAVWSVNASLPLASVRTLDEIRADSMAQTSFALVMLAIAAVVALLLGVVGIYGVIAYVAAQRTREIGIRMALGADRGAVSRLFVRHGLVLIAGGITVGLIAAALVTRVMASLLFGVRATDPIDVRRRGDRPERDRARWRPTSPRAARRGSIRRSRCDSGL